MKNKNQLLNLKKSKIFIKSFFILFFLMIFVSNVFSSNLDISMVSSFDKEGSFFVSNNHTREITFNVSFSSVTQKEGKLKLSYEIFPSKKDIEISFSCDSLEFYNTFLTTEKIYIKTQTLTETKTLKLIAEIYDKYNNLIETKSTFITITPNNSESYYHYTKQHTPPTINGYKLSRNISVLENKEDTDVVSVYVSKEPYTLYSLHCDFDDTSISLKQDYINENQINLILSSKKEIQPGEYTLDCKLQDGYNEIKLKEIQVIYFGEKIKTLEETKTTENKITAFFSFSKFDFSSSKLFILFSVFILLLFFSVLKKSS